MTPNPRRVLSVLAAILFAALPAFALDPLTNSHQIFNRGIRIGPANTNAAAGEIKWNAATTNLQVHDGTTWVPLASGTTFGWTAVSNYVFGSDYVAGAPVRRPKSIYYALVPIVASNFAPFTTNAYPVPETHPAYWGLIATNGADGSVGATGAAGANGANGLGNLFYGTWAATVNYQTNWVTNGAVIVSRNSIWYRLIAAASSNEAPESVTNSWSVEFNPGTASVFSPSNLVYRGWYNGVTTYASNDYVSWTSGVWLVSKTNTSTGVAPPLDYASITSHVWSILVPSIVGATGPQGPQGNPGQDSVVSNIVQYSLHLSNSVTLNNPSVTNPWLSFVSSTNGTNFYAWVDLPQSITNRTLLHASTVRADTLYLNGTNAITDNGTSLLRNGIAIGTGGGSGTLTQLVVGAGSSALLTVSNGAGPNVTVNLSPAVATNDAWDADIATAQSAAQSFATAAANAANATSMVGRGISTNAPTAGAAMVWNAGTGLWTPSDSPPASSTSSVSSVNNGVGNVTIQGGDGISVGTVGTTNPVLTISGHVIKRASAWRYDTNYFAGSAYTIYPATNTDNATVYNTTNLSWTWGATGICYTAISWREEGTSGSPVYWIVTVNTTDTAVTNRVSQAVVLYPSAGTGTAPDNSIVVAYRVLNATNVHYIQRYDGVNRSSGAASSGFNGVAINKNLDAVLMQ